VDPDCDDARAATAYVLGELHGPDLHAFRQHLIGCLSCREEVELLENASEAMPLMINRIAASAGAAPERTASSARRRAFVLGEVVDAEEFATNVTVLRLNDAGASRKPQADVRTARRRWLKQPVPRPAMIGLGALLIVAVITILLNHQASSIHFVRGQAAWSVGGAAVKVDGSRGQLLVEGMPRAPAGKRYEIWLMRGNDAPAPTRTWFGVNRRGEAGVAVPGDIQNVRAVLVYAEPPHAASKPDGHPYAVVALNR
jgi:hypothetical protein